MDTAQVTNGCQVICRYSLRCLVGDFVRSVCGLLICFLVVTQLPVGSGSFCVVLALGTLFMFFGVQTWRRYLTWVEFTDEFVVVNPSGCRIIWTSLTDCKLNYYSTRRDRQNGWMQLQLSSGDNIIKVDSRLESFSKLALHAESTAQLMGIKMSVTTISNFEALR